MKICDKIQTIGDTLQNNLNDRGISCTFGNGTGESTILDMVNMVNDTNFNGSNDVHLWIGANKPHLLSSETTDVIVKLENGLCEPLKYESITVSDGTNTINGVTDEKGMFVLHNVSLTGDTTFTATYGTETATCDIEVEISYLFHDDCTSDRSTEYTNGSLQSSSKTGYLTMNYNNNGYYSIQPTGNEGNHYAKWISSITGADNVKFSCEVMTNSFNGANRFGIVIGADGEYKNERFQISNKAIEHKTFVNNSEIDIGSPTNISSLAANTWYRMEYTVQGTSYTFTLKDMNDNTLFSKNGTFSSNVIISSTTKTYGLYYLNYSSSYTKYYRNIKVEAL